MLDRGCPWLALAVVALAVPSGAAAQVEPAGAFTAHFAVSGPELSELSDLGGALMADATGELGFFRIGGSIGVIGLTSDVETRSRVSMPVTATLGAVFRSGGAWFEGRFRGGFWAGATNQGLRLGAFFSTGVFAGYAIGQNVALGVGVDLWFALGHGDTIAVAPGITLAWVPWSEDF
ncbi:MAG: hypothetical protein AAGF12_35130 [Myxococcota bacterium]